MRACTSLSILSGTVALALLVATAPAQIFLEDFSVDPGLIQTDVAPNDSSDPNGNLEEYGPLYCGQWNAAGYVDVHFDRGRHTGGRTDNESSLLAIGQALTEADTFSFSLDINLTFPAHHHIGYIGLVDSSVTVNQDPGSAFFYFRDDALRFGLAQYHWELASGLPLTDGETYRVIGRHDPNGADPWQLEVINLTNGQIHWSSPFSSSVSTFSLDQIGVAGWTDGNGENTPAEIFGTSDNWAVVSSLETPTADAGSDVNVAGSCGALSMVTLTAADGAESGETGEMAIWYINDVAVGTDPVTIELSPGIYNARLTVVSYTGAATDTMTVTVSGLDPVELPKEYSMGAQINHYGGDPYYDVFSAGDGVGGELYSELEFTGASVIVNPYGGSGDGSTPPWWFGPTVNVVNDCNMPLDLTDPSMRLDFAARYFQDPLDYPSLDYDIYEEAPIYVALVDIYGNQGSLGVLYGPNTQVELGIDVEDSGTWPATLDDVPFTLITTAFDVDAGSDFTDPGFDPTLVARVRFFGTDWGGFGYDQVEFKDLKIYTTAPPTLCGDANCDGVVDTYDIDAFVAALNSEVAWEAYQTTAGLPICDFVQANDTNNDGSVDTYDIDSFVAALSGTACD